MCDVIVFLFSEILVLNALLLKCGHLITNAKWGTIPSLKKKQT